MMPWRKAVLVALALVGAASACANTEQERQAAFDALAIAQADANATTVDAAKLEAIEYGEVARRGDDKAEAAALVAEAYVLEAIAVSSDRNTVLDAAYELIRAARIDQENRAAHTARLADAACSLLAVGIDGEEPTRNVSEIATRTGSCPESSTPTSPPDDSIAALEDQATSAASQADAAEVDLCLNLADPAACAGVLEADPAHLGALLTLATQEVMSTSPDYDKALQLTERAEAGARSKDDELRVVETKRMIFQMKGDTDQAQALLEREDALRNALGY